jgi:hypothetical protein
MHRLQHKALPYRQLLCMFEAPYSQTSCASAYDDDSADDVKLAWRAWMKKDVKVSEGLSCDVLDW